MTPGKNRSRALIGSHGSRAEYIGGIVLEIPSGRQGNVQAVDSEYFVFYSKNARWRGALRQNQPDRV